MPLIIELHLKALCVLDLVFMLQDVNIYSREQTVALRTRHPWEFSQSFEFRHKRKKKKVGYKKY